MPEVNFQVFQNNSLTPMSITYNQDLGAIEVYEDGELCEDISFPEDFEQSYSDAEFYDSVESFRAENPLQLDLIWEELGL